jgi:hypothetical protein
MGAQVKIRILVALLAVLLVAVPAFAQSQDDLRAEIESIKKQLSQMEELKTRLADLEKKLDEQKTSSSVNAGFPGEKAKIDGRIFTGIFDTGDQGTDPNWSTDINDAKLRLAFSPSANVTIVNRLSTTGAKSADFDYFYLDYALPKTTLRVGQRKVDVGQETWVDNPVENMLVTNAVSHVSGYATGIALVGKLGGSAPYEIGFVNGARGVMARPTSGLPINMKIGTPLGGNLFASVSYFNSGKITASDRSAISIAEIADAPAGSTDWKRSLWELDLRYNYGGNGIRPLIPTGDLPRVTLGATYGAFGDNAVGAPDRDGKYWFVESLYRVNNRLYAAARYSAVDLDDSIFAALGKSPVAVNSYRRTSIGLGYRLTNLTHVKTEYSFNSTSGGSPKPSLNQWAIGLASKF